MSDRLKHIKDRIEYLKARRKVLKEDLPLLEQKRDWADANASAQTWYHANVAVNQAKREIKRIEKEVLELQEDAVRLRMREEIRR